VVHTWPQVPQFCESVTVLVQVPPHVVGVVPEHPETQPERAAAPESATAAAQKGVPPSGSQAPPQLPQLVWVAIWVLHPRSGSVLQLAKPGLQAPPS
jgi:hypothetical protein